MFVAPHATGTCCRGCLAKCHSIAAGRPLTAHEQDHIVPAIQRWLGTRGSTTGSAGVQQRLPLL